MVSLELVSLCKELSSIIFLDLLELAIELLLIVQNFDNFFYVKKLIVILFSFRRFPISFAALFS